MTKKLLICSLKGGTGVTTCAVNLGKMLASFGERVLIFDGDRECSGAIFEGECTDRVVYTLSDYEKGACRAKQTIVNHTKYPNLSFMSSQGVRDETCERRAIQEVEGLYDRIILDRISAVAPDSAIIVTDPYPLSIKSAERTRAYLSDSKTNDISLIVNKLCGGQIIEGDVISAEEIAVILRLPLIGVIPEDIKIPLGEMSKGTKKAFYLTAQKLCGKDSGVYNVIKPYFGISGYIKRKVRKIV